MKTKPSCLFSAFLARSPIVCVCVCVWRISVARRVHTAQTTGGWFLSGLKPPWVEVRLDLQTPHPSRPGTERRPLQAPLLCPSGTFSVGSFNELPAVFRRAMGVYSVWSYSASEHKSSRAMVSPPPPLNFSHRVKRPPVFLSSSHSCLLNNRSKVSPPFIAAAQSAVRTLWLCWSGRSLVFSLWAYLQRQYSSIECFFSLNFSRWYCGEKPLGDETLRVNSRLQILKWSNH